MKIWMPQNIILTYSLCFCNVWFMKLFLVDHLLLSRILMVPLWILSSLEFSVMQIKVESPFSTRWPGPFCSSSSGSHICCVHCCVAQMFGFQEVFWIYFVFLLKSLFPIEFKFQLKSNSFADIFIYTLDIRKIEVIVTLRLNIHQTNIAVRKPNAAATSWAQPSESFESDL